MSEPRKKARSYPECWRIIEERVKPERQRRKPDGSFALRSPQPQRFWQYADKRPALYRLLRGKDKTVAIAQVGKTLMPMQVSADQVLDAKLIVFPLASPGIWGVLTSAIHQAWLNRWTTTLETRLTYVPTRVFDTFPFPEEASLDAVARAIDVLDKVRSEFMTRSRVGLTKTYNRVDDPDENEPAIERLRQLHVDLDHAVRNSYGWGDLELDHHHCETPHGMRFTVSPGVWDELLHRLLELNHQRYVEEVAAGLHDKKSKSAPAKRAKAYDENQESML